jgi:hypothetical protein
MATDITETLEETDAEFAARFERLAATCAEDNRFSSKFKTTLEHPAFREIVAMGEKVVPLILAYLQRGGNGFIWLALPEVTGANPPIPEGYRRNREITAGWIGWDIEGMEAAWLAWGREQGYGGTNAV